jgi:putative tricarboxylic transport membrane protein
LPDATANDLNVMAFFAVFGYVCLKLDSGPILSFVPSPSMKKNIRHALLISRDDLTVHARQPLAFLISTALLLVLVKAPAICSRREQALQE